MGNLSRMMLRRGSLAAICLWLCLAGAACVAAGETPGDDAGGALDAGRDAGGGGLDAGDPGGDSGDPGTDSGDPWRDAGDPGTDSGDPERDAGGPGADAGAETIDVSDGEALRQALRSASPGTVILLQSGVYAGQFDVEVSGEAGRDIVIRGPADRSAILDGNSAVGAWQGVLTMEGRHHVVVENLEIRNTGSERYGVLVSATSQTSDGCHDIALRNLHVHDVGEEIIKIQGRNSHDILVEECIVHTNRDWSGIDVQGHWGGTPPYDQKPRRVVIRRNLIYDIPGFAGVGNEFADNVQAYDNVVLGSAMGLDIGCGNYNVVHNNLVAPYATFNALLDDPSYTAIDLSRYEAFLPSEIDAFARPDCADGIALSGNYMSLVFDNEITGCDGDLYLSYNHFVDGSAHNSERGHRANLFLRNRLHDNDAYRTVREYAKQTGGISFDQLFLYNLFARNQSATDILFEHSEGLLFLNNTLVDGDDVSLLEQSTGATIKNNLLFESSIDVSADSTGGDVGPNCSPSDSSVFSNYATGDYRLVGSGGGCVDTGADLSAVLAPLFDAYRALLDTEYDYYGDFDIDLDFELALDGGPQGASWDMGAYTEPQ